MSDLILILDDEINYATMVSDLLVSKGFRTDVCTQPREALERLDQHSYGLIITDYKMPEVDGAQLLGEVRKVLPHIPVIMISGLMGKAELLQVANIGVNLVLEKPFNVPSFLEHVARFVNPAIERATAEAFESSEPSAEGADTFAYPRPTTQVVDDSPAMRKFLNGLWRALENYVHVTLLIPEGGEFEAIVRQATEWIGEAGTHPLHISFTELGRADARERLVVHASTEGASPLVALTVPDQVEVGLAQLDDFLRWTRDEEVVSAKLHFIYALPDVIVARQFTPSSGLEDLVSKPLPLPPLRERLVDLGAWIQRLLEAAGRDHTRPLSAAAADLLLHHDWAENHRELAGTVRRALAVARRGEVTDAAVRLAMKLRHQTPPHEEAVHGIASFLQAEQARFLDQHLPKSDRFEALSKMVGGHLDRLRADREISAQPLLFAELLTVPPAR